MHRKNHRISELEKQQLIKLLKLSHTFNMRNSAVVWPSGILKVHLGDSQLELRCKDDYDKTIQT